MKQVSLSLPPLPHDTVAAVKEVNPHPMKRRRIFDAPPPFHRFRARSNCAALPSARALRM